MEHDASVASVITLKVRSYIDACSVPSSLLPLLAHFLSEPLQNIYFLMALRFHDTLWIQSDILLCVFSRWTCTGMSHVMCEPYDSYLSNSSMLAHYLGFESDKIQLMLQSQSSTAALGHITGKFLFYVCQLLDPDRDISTSYCLVMKFSADFFLNTTRWSRDMVLIVSNKTNYCYTLLHRLCNNRILD